MRVHPLTPVESQSKPGWIIEKLILCFFLVMTLVLIGISLSSSFSGWSQRQYTQMAVFVAVVMLGCCLLLWAKPSPNRVLWAIMLLSLVIRLFFAVAIPTEQISDFSILYEAAQSAAMGDFSWAHAQSGYFYYWAYQIPFALYEAVILRLFHSMLALKLFNVLVMVGANYLLYRIAKLYLSETASLCVTLIYAIHPETLVWTTVLTNQHIAVFFLLLGALFLLRATCWRDFALAGVSWAISDLMRPEAIVIVAACVGCMALRCIQRPDAAMLKRAALSLVAMLACYCLVKYLAEALLIWTGISPSGIPNRTPEWKFILGLGNVEGAGTYSAEHLDVLDMDSASRRAVLMEVIDNLSHSSVAELIHFIIGKLRVIWTNCQTSWWMFFGVDPEYQILPALGLTKSSLSYLDWGGVGTQLFVYMLALPAPILLWKSNKYGRGLFCLAVVCVAICAFLLIEVQVRYRLMVDPFWLLVSGITLDQLAQLNVLSRRPRLPNALRKE